MKINFYSILVLLLVSVFLISACSRSNSKNDQVKNSQNDTDVQTSLYDSENRKYDLVVYKSPTCGCCSGWVEAMESRGYTITVFDSDKKLREVKTALKIDPDKQSCHTSTLEGYVLEGHVHPDSIARLLKEREKIKGLYLPGMVVGSVGMEQGDRIDRYAILAVDHNNKTSIYDIYQ